MQPLNLSLDGKLVEFLCDSRAIELLPWLRPQPFNFPWITNFHSHSRFTELRDCRSRVAVCIIAKLFANRYATLLKRLNILHIKTESIEDGSRNTTGIFLGSRFSVSRFSRQWLWRSPSSGMWRIVRLHSNGRCADRIENQSRDSHIANLLARW
jgi:hypothetical protein